MSADLSLLDPSGPASHIRGAGRPVTHLLLRDALAAAWRGLVRVQHGIGGQASARYQDELDLYLEERFGGHRRWSA